MNQPQNIPGKVLDTTLRVKATGQIRDIVDSDKTVVDPTPEQALAMLEGSNEDSDTNQPSGKNRDSK